MDILIFKVNSIIFEKLSKLKNTSIYIAVTLDDALRLAYQLKPEMIILGNIDKNECASFRKFVELNPLSKIFQLSEKTDSLTNFHFLNFISKKNINFNYLIAQIEKLES